MNCLLLIIMLVAAQFNEHRKIMLFAPSANHKELKVQQEIFNQGTDGMKDRDLKIEVVVPGQKNFSLFKKYKTEEQQFTFILLGKDGGEKLRSTKPVSLQKLFSTIDAMPMRQSEMREQKNDRDD